MYAPRRALIVALALLLPVAISVPLVAGFFGAWHPALDSFAHFRAHLAVVLALVALPALFLPGIRRVGWTALLLGATAFSSTLPGLSLPGISPVSAAFRTRDDNNAIYRLLQINLRFDNRTPEKVLSLIGRLSPDVVTLNEVSRFWTPKLALLEKAYPYRIFCAVDSNVGATAVLSRRRSSRAPRAPATSTDRCRRRRSTSAGAPSPSRRCISNGLGLSSSRRRSTGWPRTLPRSARPRWSPAI